MRFILVKSMKYIVAKNGYKLIGRLVVFHTKCVGSSPTSHTIQIKKGAYILPRIPISLMAKLDASNI